MLDKATTTTVNTTPKSVINRTNRLVLRRHGTNPTAK